MTFFFKGLRGLSLFFLTSGVFLSQAVPLANSVHIETQDGYRYITANGIPNHDTGTFPNAGNPNSISEQTHSFRVPLNPQLTDTAQPMRPIFGIALNGITFEPGTGEFWNNDRSSGWQYEALTGFINLGTDHHNAHVQPTGTYHYHGIPTGLVQSDTLTHVGYAADGFPIYGLYGYEEASDPTSNIVELSSSYQLKAGTRPDGPGGRYDGAFAQDFEYVAGLGDLDECNGRTGITPEYPDGTYHYVLTTTFPFVPRCVKGTPDSSFQMAPPGRQGPPGSRPGGRPPRSGSRSGRPPHPPRDGQPPRRPPNHQHDYQPRY